MEFNEIFLNLLLENNSVHYISIIWIFVSVIFICMIPPYILGEHLVFAHAIPTEYSILPDSITKLDKFPSNISIMFSERPDPKVSHIHLLDLKNQRIDNNDFRISGQDGRLGTITLDKSKMSDNSYYSVSWFAMSLDDGHTSKGTFTVGVGDVAKKMFESNTNWDQAVEGGIVTSTIDGIIRAPLMVSQIFIAGAIISQIYLLRKFRYGSHMESICITNHNFVHRLVVLTVVSCVIIIFFATLILFRQASTIEAENNMLLTMDLMYQSPVGAIWFIRIFTAISIIIIILVFYKSKIANFLSGNTPTTLFYLVLVLCAVNLASNSIVSHSAAVTSLPSLVITSDYIHLLAVSCWIGGLFFLSSVLIPSIYKANLRDQSQMSSSVAVYRALSIIVGRFSSMAIFCLGLIGVTGLYLAWLHIYSFIDLMSSNYGYLLFTKLGFASALIIIGGYHQFVVHKRMIAEAKIKIPNLPRRNDKKTTFYKFNTTIKIESCIAIIVLIIASLLTITSPPQERQNYSGVKKSNLDIVESTPFTYNMVISKVNLGFRIFPFQVGYNIFNISLTDSGSNKPISDVSNVFAQLDKADSNLGPIIIRFTSKNTSYSANGGYLTQPGEWNVKITVQRINAYDLNYRFSLVLNNTISTYAMANDTRKEIESFNESLDSNSSMKSSSSLTLLFQILILFVVGTSIFLFIKSRKNLNDILLQFKS